MTALRVELRKLLTTRLWWILLVGLTLYMAFMAGILAVAFANPEVIGGTDEAQPFPGGELMIATSIYTLPASTGYVFPLIVGTLAVTSEFRYQTITPTLLAQPHRGVVLAAKTASSLIVGLVLGIVATAVTVAVGAGVLAAMDHPTLLTEPEIVRSIVLTCVAMGVWAIVGVGFGSVLTNQIASILVILAFTQFVEPILRFFLATNDTLADVSRFLPGAAGESLAGGGLYGGLTAVDPLPWWQGGLVLVAYALVLVVVGRFTALRKDIT